MIEVPSKEEHICLKGRIEQLEQRSYSHDEVDEIDSKLAVTISRVHNLEELLANGNRVTVHSRLSDAEDGVANLRHHHIELSGRVANLEKNVESMNALRATELAETKKRVTKIEDTIRVLNCNLENAMAALNTHMVKCDKTPLKHDDACDAARYSVCCTRLNKMEECCRNTVAAGKDLEKRVGFVESSLRNQSSRLDQHKANLDGLTKQAVRSQKFMDKLHDL